ncbi:MAG: filamentous hemagglutinin N-terminal domain-containing protein, partial [Candidatus Marinamargulisbacteria bacterium]|nr:filamentous hemagglutinin N-terminal domain-containing protein [Candidatus Marinamargulisbacteria bacterium]
MINQRIAKILIIQFIINTVLTPWVLAIEPSVVDAQSPTVQIYRANNGVDVVDIAGANAQGLSDNYFRSYNVPNTGIVVNNNLDLNKVSLMAGRVLPPNANLNNGNGLANMIVFQITGTERTQVQGLTEIHGGAANFMVANPNGISVNGGGFYNA